jgi:negative regulator of replication initiation
MNSIQIRVDEQVLAELSKRAVGFNVTPNDVLRRILDLEVPSPLSIPKESLRPIAKFIQSQAFTTLHQAVDRYLALLGWLYAQQQASFSDAALRFHRGRRMYFAKSEKEILESGDGISAKPIPQSPFWALVTLDNKSKRIVIEEMFRTLGYSKDDIQIALDKLADSGIRRGRNAARLKFLESL